MKKGLILSTVTLVLLVVAACETTELPDAREAVLDLPATPYDYGNNVDDHIPTLGRVLFYDRRLSVNNSISCSSCHKQALAFADNARLSVGFESKLTKRNSMPIQNLGSGGLISFDKGFSDSVTVGIPVDFVPFQEVLFWDGREQMLDKMVLRPIVNHVEMGINDLGALADKLSAVPFYNDLFTRAYGDPGITSERIADALSWFVRSIRSDHTRLDRAFSDSTAQSKLTPEEFEGQRLFVEKYQCNSCHQVQSPHGYQFAGTFANIGLDAQYADNGVEEVTKQGADAGRFKIPSLRNVALTAPYMHDGRFTTLDEVIEHYKDGIQDHPALDARLRNPDGSPRRFQITDQERKAIIAFLNTLTDEKMIHDIRLSNPFSVR